MSSFVFHTIPTLTLLDRHGIHVIRQTLADLAVSAFLNPSTLALTIPSASSLRNCPSAYEISTICSCTPYTPSDFPAPSYYDTHFLLERRRAIECSLLPLQLAGGKKVQEALSRPGVLEGFLEDEGTRWIWDCGCPSISLYTTDIRDTWWGDVGAPLRMPIL
jgi:glutathione synthase